MWPKHLTNNKNTRGPSRRVSHNKTPDYRRGIPSFQSDQVQTLKYRYILTDAAADVVSFNFELPIFPWALATSALSLSAPQKSVRLRKIRLWTNYRSSVGMTGNTQSVTYLERRGVRPMEIASTATFEVPAKYEKSFGADDLLGWFYHTTAGESNPEITFQMTKGSILELTFDYILDDADIVVTAVGSGLTSSRIYSNTINSNLACVGKAYQTPFTV